MSALQGLPDVISMDYWLRLAPNCGIVGVLTPEYQSVGPWGMYSLPDKVEIFKFRNHGPNIGGKLVTSFTNDRGSFLSIVPGDTGTEHRIKADEQLLASIVGFERDEVEVLVA